MGFNTGNLSKGITFVDRPDGIKTNSADSVGVAKQIEKLVVESGIEPYDKRINKGFFRLLLYRESKRTNQVLLSLVVSGDFFIDEAQEKWVEDHLIKLF